MFRGTDTRSNAAFMPKTRKIIFCLRPEKSPGFDLPQGSGVRDDGGVYEGAEVSIYYDPMISKLAVYGRNRTEAIDRMRRALQEYEVGGIKTTIPFFREIMEDEEFIAGKLDTGFIARFNERKIEAETDQQTKDLALIASVLAFEKNREVKNQAVPTEQTSEPLGFSRKKCRAQQSAVKTLFV